MHQILYLLGLTDPSGPPYLFWSGIGGYMTITAVIYKKLNCHEPGCWRMGHHPYKHYQYCKNHHPLERDKNNV